MFHPVIRLLPLTALNDGLRAIMLEGDGVISLLPEVLVLGLCAAGSLLVALRIFRWQ
jgi:ABC-type multidrug transport system permease subunit